MSHSRPLSSLKSPILSHHLMENVDIHYPSQFISHRTIYKQSLIADDGNFRAAIDVHDFDENEVRITTTGHTILISCAHDFKEDEHGGITRSFSKKYVLPLDLDIDALESSISKSTGVLYIKVPPKELEMETRVVNIKID